MRTYQLPPNILVNQNTYERWLTRKARSIRQRGSKKDNTKHGGLKVYKDAIHEAVYASNGKDFYTGEQLDWSLLSKYNNEDSHKDGIKYMKKLALMPSVDHYDNRTEINFVICSLLVNDAKNHMSHDEFLELCRKVIIHHKKIKDRKVNK